MSQLMIDGFRRRLNQIQTGIFIWLGGCCLLVQGQMPNLSEAGELWRGEVDGVTLRVWHIPRRPATLLSIRFGIEEISTPSTTSTTSSAQSPSIAHSSGFVEHLDRVEITAVDGVEAIRSYSPRTDRLVHWHSSLSEARETFRAPGVYRIRFFSSQGKTSDLDVELPIQRHSYLGFGLEMAAFIGGCIVLGAILIAIVLYLHRRSAGRPGSAVAPSPLAIDLAQVVSVEHSNVAQ